MPIIQSVKYCQEDYHECIRPEKRGTSSKSVALGQVLATTLAREILSDVEIHNTLQRLAKGNWGDVCSEDYQANEEALLTSARLLSMYFTEQNVKFWIITEADRSATTILLPEEY